MEPLAIKLRPNKLDDVVGQKHLIGKDKILTNIVKNKYLFSMILYGKPGIGKTSIANSLVNELGLKYRNLNAVINNKKDFDIVIKEAEMYGGIVLVLDEIHRMNKDKQDLLLPHLESGLLTLIGLTTSNPYHSINPAIRSRCQIYELKELDDNDIKDGINKAINSGYLKDIKIDDESINYIIKLANGDLRYAYNILETAYYSSSDFNINLDYLKSINNKPVMYFDKNADEHYDLLSAFQKSIRGSDVNASLHYLARLIASGDFDSLYRRLAVITYEDIGLANPSMGTKVLSAIELCERIGFPEARIPLSVVVVELALSPKSNSAYLALDIALQDVQNGNIGRIPDTIKINSRIYKYPHDYPNAIVSQQYMPDKLKGKEYYKPKVTSKYESNLKEVYDKIKKSL